MATGPNPVAVNVNTGALSYPAVTAGAVTADSLTSADDVTSTDDVIVGDDISLGDDVALASGSVLTWAGDTALARSGAGALSIGGSGILTHAIADAKGDLLLGTADNAVARVAVGADGNFLVADSSQTAGVKWSPRSFSVGDVLSAGGEAVADRGKITASTSTWASGTLYLTYFTAQVSETINTLVMYTSGTAAATVTLIRYGIYSVAANGDLTLVASTANDTALLAVTSTRYPKATSAPWSKVAGVRYAAGGLVVATTPPAMTAISAQAATMFDTLFAQEPRLFAAVNSQSDLPSSVVNAGLSTSRRAPYVEMLP